MSKAQRLNKINKALDYKKKQLQQQMVAARSELAALDKNKLLIDDSRQKNDLPVGVRFHPLTGWNNNDFSLMINEVSSLLEQKMADQKHQLNVLQNSLKLEAVKVRGVEHLVTQEDKRIKEQDSRQRLLDTEELLQK